MHSTHFVSNKIITLQICWDCFNLDLFIWILFIWIRGTGRGRDKLHILGTMTGRGRGKDTTRATWRWDENGTRTAQIERMILGSQSANCKMHDDRHSRVSKNKKFGWIWLISTKSGGTPGYYFAYVKEYTGQSISLNLRVLFKQKLKKRLSQTLNNSDTKQLLFESKRLFSPSRRK